MLMSACRAVRII